LLVLAWNWRRPAPEPIDDVAALALLELALHDTPEAATRD
jgi:hypothetical protein